MAAKMAAVNQMRQIWRLLDENYLNEAFSIIFL